MASKLWFLIKVSLNRKIKTKWFVIVNALLAILIVALANIDIIITFFGGEFDRKEQVYVVDKTEKSYDILSEQLLAMEKRVFGFDESSFELNLIDKDDYDEFDYEEIIAEEPSSIVIYLMPSENVIEAKLITEVYLGTVKQQIILGALNETKAIIALLETEIDQDELAKITTPIEVERVILDEEKDSEEEMQAAIMTTVFPFVILPFFMLTIFLVQMIGAEVNDEKSSHGMEIIISSVPPKIHFFAKIIAGNLFVIIQGLLLFIFGLIALLTRQLIPSTGITDGVSAEVGNLVRMVLDSEFGSQLVYIIPLTLILMLLTFIAYALLAGILASMTTNIEDFQQLQTPIVIILVIGYYLSIMAGVFTGATFIKVLSFVPLLSAILSPSLLVLEQISITEVLISILLMVIFNYLLIRYGLKVYKVGILNYSTTGLWKKMFKALRS